MLHFCTHCSPLLPHRNCATVYSRVQEGASTGAATRAEFRAVVVLGEVKRAAHQQQQELEVAQRRPSVVVCLVDELGHCHLQQAAPLGRGAWALPIPACRRCSCAAQAHLVEVMPWARRCLNLAVLSHCSCWCASCLVSAAAVLLLLL